ncbi:hypothetical protein [Streptomyces roseifaciens]|uniref:hypothetical protein n=1 Tax=Streptomyces roseifaciens TaxID=1488406 RepID=UPI0007182211|nr:hypothetical protein [Streptomyces roseifaciens]
MPPADPDTEPAPAPAPAPTRGTAERGTLCPSSTCHEGAVLIAVLGEDGRLGYLRPAMRVDEQFIEACAGHGDPESRFRFADTCAQGDCEHWSGRHCSLIGRLADARPEAAPGPGDSDSDSDSETLPRCGIRAACRWFAQDGPRACGVCPLVVYRPTGIKP